MSTIINPFIISGFDPSLILYTDPSISSSINAGSPSTSDPVTTIQDQTTNDNDLINDSGSNRVTWEDTYLAHSAATKYLENTDSEFDFGTTGGSFTTQTWFYPTTTGNHPVLQKYRTSDGQESYQLFSSGGSEFKFIVKDSIGGFPIVASGVTFSINTWYYILSMYDASANLIKISATAEGGGSAQTFVTTANTNGIAASSAPLRLGYNGFGGLVGRTGKTYVYNEARSQAEVEIDYQIGH